MKPTEIRDLTDDELLAKEKELERSVFNLRIQYATGQLTNSAALQLGKRDLARVKTAIRERKLARPAEKAPKRANAPSRAGSKE